MKATVKSGAGTTDGKADSEVPFHRLRFPAWIEDPRARGAKEGKVPSGFLKGM